MTKAIGIGIGVTLTVTLSLAVAASGCGKKGQSFKAGVALLCDRGRIDEAIKGAPYGEWPARIDAWASKNLTNADARKLAKDLTSAPPRARAQILLTGTSSAGISDCGISGLFEFTPLGVDPRDVAASAWALGVGGEMVKALLGQPFDPALQGPDPTADIRKVDCEPGPLCKVPVDHWVNEAGVLNKPTTAAVGVAVELVLEKGGKFLRTGLVAWDAAHAKAFGDHPVEWTATGALAAYDGERSVSDPAALAAAAPALMGFVARTLDCLVPPRCMLEIRSARSIEIGGSYADRLASMDGLTQPVDAVGTADDAAQGWQIIDVRVMPLIAPEPGDDQRISVLAQWMPVKLVAAGGKVYLSPFTEMRSAHF